MKYLLFIITAFLCSCIYERRSYNLADRMEQWQKDLIKDVNGLHKVYLCAENKFILKGKVRIKLKKDSVFLMKIKKRKGYFFPYQKKVKGKWNDNIWDGRIEAETTYYDDIPLSIWLYPFPNKTDSCKPGFYLK